MRMMIRGSNVLLRGETVRNVLIGSPSADGREYTLGIPKGDTHDWADAKVGFRGSEWRTIGLPETGEDANIPLCWGSNIKVRLIEPNLGITVYERAGYARHFYSDAEYFDGRGITVDRTGSQPADDVRALIYSCTETDGYIPKAGDIILNGEVGFEFDTTGEQSASVSMKLFREQYPAFAVIKAVAAIKNGYKNDIEITAR